MKSFLFALQFLTILPVRISTPDKKTFAQAMAYFPLIGLLLGLVLSGIGFLLDALSFAQLTIDTLLVVSLILLTGGMHLDGLSDTFDALFSGKPKEEMLRIMRDSHAGVMGILVVISVILLKITLLFSVGSNFAPAALILMCVLSRWSLVFQMFFFAYARKEGKASEFMGNLNLKVFMVATLLMLVCCFTAWSFSGVFLALFTATLSFFLGRLFSRKFGGITGDTLGAANELSEVAVLFFIVTLKGAWLWIKG